MIEWFLGQGAVSLILQIACIIHVIRTDRVWWWIPAILLFPWLGVFAYVLVELVPEWRGGRNGERSVPFGSSTGSGRESMRTLKRLVEATPTVENRARLANAHLRKGHAAEAVHIYEGCLEGFYAEDKNLWYELAEAYHANGQHEAAHRYLAKLEKANFRDYRDRRELIMGLTLEALGRIDEAVHRLEHVVPTFPGQEANFHYARLLMAHGEGEKGRIVIEGMLKRRRSHDARYRRREAQWYSAAKKLLH